MRLLLFLLLSKELVLLLTSLFRVWYFWEAACQGLPGFCARHCRWWRDSTFTSGLLLHVGVCAYHLCPSPAGCLVSVHSSWTQAAGDQDPEAGIPAGPSHWCQGHMNWMEMARSCTQTLFKSSSSPSICLEVHFCHCKTFNSAERDMYCLVTTSHYWDVSLYYEMLSQNTQRIYPII